ncbi:hypothetical protein MMC29_004851 [Sticta canariensis]|nr:hypothetical protein [Sticta canariensis]
MPSYTAIATLIVTSLRLIGSQSIDPESVDQGTKTRLPNRPKIRSHPHPHPHRELPQQMTRRSIQALEEVRHQHRPVEAGVQTEPKPSRSVLAAHMD